MWSPSRSRLRRKPSTLIGDANVVQADIMASDGVVHKIDAVLLPAKDLYETIDEHGDLDKFQKMLKRANLEDNLEKKPWTVFAPNDRAEGGRRIVFHLLRSGTWPARVVSGACAVDLRVEGGIEVQ